MNLLPIRLLAALLPLLSGACLPALAQSAAAPSPNLAGLAHVALRVKDLDASIAFFEKLGFVRAFALSRDGKVYEAFIKINDQQFLELYPATPDHAQTGFLHVCFFGNDLQSVHDFYVAHGLQPTAVKTAGAGNLLFTMPGPATPTGPQNMEYTQYMPGSLHSKDIGQHLGAERISDSMVGVTLAADEPARARAFYLDRAGFLPGSGQAVRLPGGSEQTLDIVPATPLGFRARITLGIKDLAATEAALRQRAVGFRKVGDTLVVSDPDGDEVVLAISRQPA